MNEVLARVSYDLQFYFGFALFVVFIVIAGVIQKRREKDRDEKLIAVAEKLGLDFSPNEDRLLHERFAWLNTMSMGSNRYAENICSGFYKSNEVFVFDYHYETYSNSKRGQETTHHWHTFFICIVPGQLPKLTISKERLSNKVAQTFGADDIDFESAEFSRKFWVQSSRKKFAYDFCNPQMMEFLLLHPDLNLEVDGETLAIFNSLRVPSSQIESNLERLVKIRSLLPNYLFTKA